jgi:hypothetical protein
MSSNDLNEIPLPSGYMLPNAAMTPFMPPAPLPPQFNSRTGMLMSSKKEKVHKDPPGKIGFFI